MPETFGARLRRQREHQNITLAAITEQTKIKMSLLDGLERDDVSHWPSGIFRRAYIRAYADAIGLSPDVVVREFVEVYPEPVEDLATISAVATTGDASRSGGPPTRLRYIVGSALESLSRFRRAPAKEDSDRGQFVHDPARFEPAPEAIPDVPSETIHVYHPDAVADDGPIADVAQAGPDLLHVAQICTELARVGNAGDLQAQLQQAAAFLDASGVIIWLWDPSRSELRAALAHGYSDKVLAQLPAVSRDADNATATAFRSAQMCVVKGSDHTSGALAVPMLTAEGCAGVLALELQHGGEQAPAARAVATIFAALLAQLVGGQAGVERQAGTAVSAQAR